jgi:Molybdopterin converting factor, small subunit
MNMKTPSAPPVARIRARFFAAAKAEIGTAQTSWQVPAGTTVRAALASAGLETSAVVARSSFLVNGIASDRETVLRDGDELDVLPPFAGG